MENIGPDEEITRAVELYITLAKWNQPRISFESFFNLMSDRTSFKDWATTERLFAQKSGLSWWVGEGGSR